MALWRGRPQTVGSLMVQGWPLAPSVAAQGMYSPSLVLRCQCQDKVGPWPGWMGPLSLTAGDPSGQWPVWLIHQHQDG